ncbi:type II toxin-antitoxin system death-on-curing family toxin [Cloacibacillus sp. An23]|uniref:type II toxin-antitoxin system death-on-curing family toxin n=1 Tax=Cloacibacillus sp. An23 TaxID=1965591 RepID=UPI000B38F59C|nr:type II toxin-antitoxin system death-on-curing family toxin [Cloacibacillus sp. An23]OUO94743.1 death-on-curing protein [Cloacibacillus sp. An23]
MKTLSKRQILALHEYLIIETGGQAGLRDDGLLESALAAPFASFGSEELYPTLVHKAARLGFGLVKNHAFIDGNKRIAAHATLVFLAINGIELRYTQQELSDIFLKLAAGEAQYEDLLAWIKEHDA